VLAQCTDKQTESNPPLSDHRDPEVGKVKAYDVRGFEYNINAGSTSKLLEASHPIKKINILGNIANHFHFSVGNKKK
jgi:hypothetical protein